MSDCPFCEIIQNDAASVLYRGRWSVAITPLNPVTEGHTLVIPAQHREFLWEMDEDVLRYTMNDVVGIAHRFSQDDLDINVIQSNGPAATQTIKHVHFHIVPRRPGDGLALPWSPPSHNRDTE